MKDRTVFILAVLAVFLLLTFGGGMMMGFGMTLGILIWAIILALIYYLLADRAKFKEEESALEILETRYARGEITREEYLEMKEEIMRT